MNGPDLRDADGCGEQKKGADLLLVDTGDLHDGAWIQYSRPTLLYTLFRYWAFRWLPSRRVGRGGCKSDYIIHSIELSWRSYVLSQSDEFFARLPYDLLTIGK
jgi:hypothetical protein